ncbi:MAG: hypothetical protein V9E99_00940 [Microthrixaceae bacterium]
MATAPEPTCVAPEPSCRATMTSPVGVTQAIRPFSLRTRAGGAVDVGVAPASA